MLILFKLFVCLGLKSAELLRGSAGAKFPGFDSNSQFFFPLRQPLCGQKRIVCPLRPGAISQIDFFFKTRPFFFNPGQPRGVYPADVRVCINHAESCKTVVNSVDTAVERRRIRQVRGIEQGVIHRGNISGKLQNLFPC